MEKKGKKSSENTPNNFLLIETRQLVVQNDCVNLVELTLKLHNIYKYLLFHRHPHSKW